MATQNEAVAAQLAADKTARDKSQAEYAERMKGKPTPTQEENDRIVLGEHVVDKEPDGSPVEEDRRLSPTGHAVTKSSEAKKPASSSSSYDTRASTASKSEK